MSGKIRNFHRRWVVVTIIAGICVIIAAIIMSRSESNRAEPATRKFKIQNSKPVLSKVEGFKIPTPRLRGDKLTPAEGPRFAGTQAGGGWPMFRGGQRLLGRAPGTLPDSMRLVWKFKTDGQIKSSPAIDDGLVFVGSSDANIYGIDLENGRQVWQYRTSDAVEASPCMVEGSVFVGSSDNFLYALDAKTGKLRWKYETGGQILGAANWTQSPDPPKAGRTWILVGSYDNKLHCVDSANGKVIWTYETDSYINGLPAIDKFEIRNSKFEIPAKGGVAVFGGCDAMIHVVSLADGSKVTQIDTGSFIAASAAFYEGRVYVGNYDGVFISADIASGEIVWKYKSGDASFFSSAAVGENIVVVGGRDKRVHCLGRDDGKLLWTFQTLGEVDSSPVICGDKIIVGSKDGRIYMIRLSDGSQVWSYEIGQAITSSPAVSNGVVVVGSDDGYVYAFQGH